MRARSRPSSAHEHLRETPIRQSFAARLDLPGRLAAATLLLAALAPLPTSAHPGDDWQDEIECDRDCGLDAPRDNDGCCVGSDDGCPAGQVRNEDTAGQCCWPGQAWSVIRDRCIGRPDCPPPLAVDADGESCGQGACPDGRVRSGDTAGRCCWPRQVWSVEQRRCVGHPACPPGRIVRDEDCAPPPPGPPRPDPRQPRLPYTPVADGDYLLLPPTRFVQGSPAGEPGRFRNERARPVELTRAVAIKRTEVTQREWRSVIGPNPAYFSGCGDECPVERVSWYEALAYLNALSQAERLPPCYTLRGCQGLLGSACDPEGAGGRFCAGDYVCAVDFAGLDCAGFRLPTEAEWEAAARFPAATVDRAPTEDDPTHRAIYAATARADYPDAVTCIAPLAARSPETLGAAVSDGPGPPSGAAPAAPPPEPKCGPAAVSTSLGVAPRGAAPGSPGWQDLRGNVSEWVWDAFATYPSGAVRDPVVTVGGARGIRGGSWLDGVAGLRPALRGRGAPGARNYTVGFRAARTLREAPPGAAAGHAVGRWLLPETPAAPPAESPDAGATAPAHPPPADAGSTPPGVEGGAPIRRVRLRAPTP